MLEVHFKAAVYALFAASGGAIVGSLLDSYGEHSNARLVGIVAGVAAYIWRVGKG